MFDWLKKRWPFRKKGEQDEAFSDERRKEHYVAKQAALEKILGPMDDVVGHAIIPFCVGGAVDMYYFPQHLPGTVFATMELIDPAGNGPKPNRLGTYELVACTRLARAPAGATPATEDSESTPTPFDRREERIWRLLTQVAHHSFGAVIQPGDTCEIPGNENTDTLYVVFDEFDTRGVPFRVQGLTHGLLLCIDVHRFELDHAREHGVPSLLAKLKAAGVYPYSDLDRLAVV